MAKVIVKQTLVTFALLKTFVRIKADTEANSQSLKQDTQGILQKENRGLVFDSF